MAAEGKKGEPKKQITDEQRFKYIGFDVFPGKPKDLFKSEAEKTKYVDALKARREKGDIIRDECTLIEERVSGLDRIVLLAASVIIVATLFIPWFTMYNEKVEETTVAAEPMETMADSTMLASATDSLGNILSNDSAMMADATDSALAAGATAGDENTPAVNDPVHETTGEEVLHGYVAKKKITKEYSRIPGYSVFTSIGSLGDYIFSSGIILMLTGVLFFLQVLMTLLLPIYTLYGIFGMKGDADTKALALKKVLKFNWIPVILFILSMLLSFIGAEYGFDSQAVFSSLGDAYGPGVFLDSLSFGVTVSLGAFILLALKGVEI
ncbi:MAG: hypothetical protein DWP97_12835 [Calditrichaeota bacterium]|nr:MAG: hypothetical protein DWP97_12835 [Calditrichota bacterium]